MTGDVRITVTRRLRLQQQARRARLVSAARELAAEGGHAAVTMNDVADRAGVARTTVYRYFSSKDHLLAEMAADWVGGLEVDVSGGTSTERLGALLEAMVELAAADLNLTAAAVQAITSQDAGADDERTRLFHFARERFRAAIDPVAPPRTIAGVPMEDVEVVVGHIVLAALVSLTTLARPREEVAAMARTSARLILQQASAPGNAAPEPAEEQHARPTPEGDPDADALSDEEPVADLYARVVEQGDRDAAFHLTEELQAFKDWLNDPE